MTQTFALSRIRRWDDTPATHPQQSPLLRELIYSIGKVYKAIKLKKQKNRCLELSWWIREDPHDSCRFSLSCSRMALMGHYNQHHAERQMLSRATSARRQQHRLDCSAQTLSSNQNRVDANYISGTWTLQERPIGMGAELRYLMWLEGLWVTGFRGNCSYHTFSIVLYSPLIWCSGVSY